MQDKTFKVSSPLIIQSQKSAEVLLKWYYKNLNYVTKSDCMGSHQSSLFIIIGNKNSPSFERTFCHLSSHLLNQHNFEILAQKYWETLHIEVTSMQLN